MSLPPLGSFLLLAVQAGAGGGVTPPRAFNKKFCHAQAAEMNNSVKEAQEMLFFQSLDSGRGREGKVICELTGDSHTGERRERKNLHGSHYRIDGSLF